MNETDTPQLATLCTHLFRWYWFPCFVVEKVPLLIILTKTWFQGSGRVVATISCFSLVSAIAAQAVGCRLEWVSEQVSELVNE